jgi:desulfoferrodoxin (superoxide reductase-like protein)
MRLRILKANANAAMNNANQLTATSQMNMHGAWRNPQCASACATNHTNACALALALNANARAAMSNATQHTSTSQQNMHGAWRNALSAGACATTAFHHRKKIG